jgi:pyruvate,water dikinase
LIDAKPNEFQPVEAIEEEPKEENPLAGWRGIRRSLGQQELLKCELDAIKALHAGGLTNVCLMLPFVVNVEEFRAVKNMLEFPLKIGVMIETPAAALEIEKFCSEGIDFVSIGSNDLTQLTLGADRGNPRTSSTYSELHTAVLSLIKKTIETCKQFGVKTSICGEGPSNLPELVEKLVEFGIDSISVDLDAVERVKTAVLRTERRMLLDRVRKQSAL